MAIKKVGFKRGNKTSGTAPKGQKIFLVGSTVKVADDIDPILDASFLGGTAIPAYDDPWNGDNTSLLAFDKRADPWDEVEGTQEGYWWTVTVDYAIPESIQTALDPVDRDWTWSKTPDKREIASAKPTFKAVDYVYPGSDLTHMILLDTTDAWQNTIGEPPEGGVPRVVSRQTINMTKYTTKGSPSSIGPASWQALDSYQDMVNSDTIVILDVTYDPLELLMDEVSYSNVTENGFDRVKITFKLIVDKEFKHVFTYQNASFNQVLVEGQKRQAIKNEDGQDVNSPQLIDDEGLEIALPATSPYIKEPWLIAAGVQNLAEFNDISFPTSIP